MPAAQTNPGKRAPFLYQGYPAAQLCLAAGHEGGGGLPPLSIWHGIPKSEGDAGQYVKSESATEQEFASEEMDAA